MRAFGHPKIGTSFLPGPSRSDSKLQKQSGNLEIKSHLCGNAQSCTLGMRYSVGNFKFVSFCKKLLFKEAKAARDCNDVSGRSEAASKNVEPQTARKWQKPERREGREILVECSQTAFVSSACKVCRPRLSLRLSLERHRPIFGIPKFPMPNRSCLHRPYCASFLPSAQRARMLAN